MTKLGGARMGRPRRKEPKAKLIWCGQEMTPEARQYILDNTTPEQRFRVLMDLATRNYVYESTTDTSAD